MSGWIATDGVHLMARDSDTLHRTAKSVGLKRCWFHGGKSHPHYDICGQRKRTAAIRDGLKRLGVPFVTSKELVALYRK